MSYRRFVLIAFAGFVAFLLWTALGLDTSTGAGAMWPLVFALLVILMLPEDRLQGDTLVKLIAALKGVKKDDL